MGVTSQPDYASLAILGVAFLAGLIVALVAVQRIKQYSLRTLLIIMTVVAVALGSIVYVTQK
jgi:undecaprenyl pyrophosphate phosphatase UppP